MTATPRLRRLAPAALVLAGLVAVSGTTGAVAGAMITGADVKDSSLTGRDIKDGSIGYQDTSLALDREHRKVGGYQVVRASVQIDDGDTNSVTATCPAGRSLLGTSAWWANSTDAVQVEIKSYAGYTRRATAWGRNQTGQDDTVVLALFCGRASAS